MLFHNQNKIKYHVILTAGVNRTTVVYNLKLSTLIVEAPRSKKVVFWPRWLYVRKFNRKSLWKYDLNLCSNIKYIGLTVRIGNIDAPLQDYI